MWEKVFEALKGSLSTWWLNNPPMRKAQDILVAGMAAVMILGGMLVYQNLDTATLLLRQRISQRVLDVDRAKTEIDAMLKSLAPQGAVGLFLTEIDLDRNTRRVVEWRATAEEKPTFDKLGLGDALPLIGDNHYDMPTLRALIEGRPAWTPGVRTRFLRLICPVPPIYGALTIGAVGVAVRPDATEAQRAVIETRIVAWAATLAR